MRVATALVAACLCAAVAAPADADAQAPSVDLVCLFTGQYNFSPPLNFTTTTASAMGHVSMCNSPNGSRPQLKSAVLFNTRQTVATGCAPAPFTLTITQQQLIWNDGSRSLVDGKVSTDPTSGEVGLRADITAGPMVGARFTGAPIIVSQAGVCLLGGVRSFTLGLGVITVTHTTAAKRKRPGRRARSRT